MTVDAPRHASKLALTPSRRRALPYLLIFPSVGILVLALGYPVVWQLVTSMQQFGLRQQFGQPADFVWFQNYLALATDPELWGVVVRSIVFCVVTAAVTMVIGVLLALLMNAVGKTVRIILQVAMLLAWAMPVVAAMTVWTWLFNWRRGLVNWVLTSMGIDFQGHNWLLEPLSFYFIAMLVIVWMSVPFVALSVFAGLTQISDEITEASEMDGANGWQRLWSIIVPMIRPILSIVLLLQLIWDLRVFTQIKLLQDAGSIANETNLLGTYIYQIGTAASDFGMASAVSVFILALTVGLSWFYVRSMLKEDES